MRYAVFEVPAMDGVIQAAVPLHPESGFNVREAEKRVMRDDPIWRQGNHKLAFYVELNGHRHPFRPIFRFVSHKRLRHANSNRRAA